MMVSELDMELQLLSDDPIYVGAVPVCKVSFKDIARVGPTRYMHILGLLSIDAEGIEMILGAGHTPLEMIQALRLYDASLDADLAAVCKILFSVEPLPVGTEPIIQFGEFSLMEDNYQDVLNVVRWRNNMHDVPEEDEGNPADAATAELIRRRNELRKRLAKQKGESENAISIVDLVSIYAAVAHLPLSEVMKYDIYQLNNQFQRSQMYETYETQINAMMHGAKVEGDDLKHYARKIKQNDDD